MSGYIGPVPVPQSIQRRQTFTATAGQTTFGTTGYTDGDYIDVYLNGVKLVGGTDYTATNGTDIVLTTAASASDVLDFVTFNSFTLVDETIQFADGTAAAPSITNVGDTNTGIFFPASDSIGFAEGGSEIARIASNGFFIGKGGQNTSLTGQEFRSDDQVAFTRDGGHPLLLNRKTSDGNIALFQKDETTVGSIGTTGSRLYTGTGDTGLFFNDQVDSIDPWNTSTNAGRDGAIDLGDGSRRFKNLYLSGGVYLGGTGSANQLTEYEEGTWTPTVNVGSISATRSTYVKVGDHVFVQSNLADITETSSTSDIQIGGLPFTSFNDTQGAGSVMFRYLNAPTNATQLNTLIGPNQSHVTFYWSFANGATWDGLQFAHASTGPWDLIIGISYRATG